MFAMFNFSIIQLLLVFNVFVFIEGLEENDPCTFNDETEGICKFLTECPAALELLQRGQFPEKLCGFQGTQSIVCCRGGAGAATSQPTVTASPTRRPTKPKPPPTRKPTPKPTPVSFTNRSPGDISKEKCKDYAQYAYDRSESPVLSLVSHYANTLECAFEKLQLIVGGTLASRQEFPHMALIGYKTGDEVQWSCGGSLISERYILTAGHCLKHRELGSAKLVRLGMTNQSDIVNRQEIGVSEVIRYPEYINEKYHDIGLLKLDKDADLNTYVRPACLQTEKSIQFSKAIASGWGNIEFSGRSSNDLLKVVLEFFPTDKCNQTYRREIINENSNLKNGIIEDLMICAGSSKELKDTCQGDSGGPLQVYHEDTEDIKCMYNIVGVTSFGKSCGLAKNVPGVYTRVSSYIKWIEDTVWPVKKLPVKYVRLGITNQNDPYQLQQLLVSEIIPYPQYTSRSKYHDIALLRLSENVKLNPYVRPACLSTHEVIPTRLAIVSGWGNIGYLESESKDLLKVVLELLPSETCNATFRKQITSRLGYLKQGFTEDTMICAGSRNETKNTCKGDSGGPLQVYHEESPGIMCMYDIVGVTSFGKPCGLSPGIPEVFTRVFCYIEWIENEVWPE